MSSQAVRVSFQHVDEPNEVMRMDVVLAGAKLKAGQEYYGIWEHKGESMQCPFVLTRDGRIDYGVHAEEDQFYGTDFLEKNFGVGETVMCSQGEDEFDYKIVSITPLS
jgi:hypothetical protein